jgi:hypothetical protein
MTTSATELKARVTRGEERRGRGVRIRGPFYFVTTVNYWFAGLFGLVGDLFAPRSLFPFCCKNG